ncbi:MAG: ComF family protein [Anaerolineales bacterium]|nr:ComF family protein [Anaerolineales bacterium]
MSRFNSSKLQQSSPIGASFVLFQTLWDSLQSLVFPDICAGCQRVGHLICSNCLQQLITPFTPFDADGFDGFTCIGTHSGPLRKIIHALKYEATPRLAQPLGALLTQQLHQQKWSFDTIIPVPLHQHREEERGYNQAKIIAHALVVENTIVMDALARTRETPTQVGKTAAERKTNVNDAFALKPAFLPQQLEGKRVLLIDDVCTSGATLVACAAPLRAAGVVTLYAATLSRAHFTPLI